MITNKELEDKQIVFGYLLEEGVNTDGDWNYYGGHWTSNVKTKYHPTQDEIKQEKNNYISKVKSIGVDWEKTNFPVYECKSEFMDSDSPSADVDTILGELILLDGSSVKFGAHDVDDFILDILEMYKNLKTHENSTSKYLSFWK